MHYSGKSNLYNTDYGNATLAGITSLQLRLQSVINAARLVLSASCSDHFTPLLRRLHWLRTPECSVQVGGVGLPMFT